MKKQQKKQLDRKQRIPLAHIAEHEVYPFIKDYIQVYKFSPSQAEIGLAFKRTQEWASLVLKELIKLKKIKMVKHKQRSIKLID